ncbi:hypothetical protein BN1723_005678 [Verticillium longisporum]|uniref:Uncharacterized protein n=1 Tax=Verticillium longisporum TaxID=100787 RepID=A0A0G4NAU3_VERLO|nr:hypothetical protein BN1723_005678 [Verticillium longisporum]
MRHALPLRDLSIILGSSSSCIISLLRIPLWGFGAREGGCGAIEARNNDNTPKVLRCAAWKKALRPRRRSSKVVHHETFPPVAGFLQHNDHLVVKSNPVASVIPLIS